MFALVEGSLCDVPVPQLSERSECSEQNEWYEGVDGANSAFETVPGLCSSGILSHTSCTKGVGEVTSRR